MMARVRDVKAAGTRRGSMLWVLRFGSTGTGVAPHWLTANQVAMKVFDGTMTSSPGPMP